VTSPPATRIPGTYAAAATAAAVIAQQVAGKAVRDALFLSTFRATTLPYAMAVAAVLSLVTAVWLARLIARKSPAVIMPALFAVSAAGLALEWAVGFVSAPISAVAVYFHTALFGPAVLTAFWSFINERFDPHTARVAVARIGSGGTLGGVLGGIAAWRASLLISLPTVILLLAVVNAGCLVGIIVVRSRTDEPRVSRPLAETKATSDAASTFAVLRDAPFLRSLALLVGLGAAISSLLDYVFSVEATTAFGKGPPLLAFFSLFWLAVSILSFLLQLALGRIAMEKLGLATNVAILPGIIIFGGAVGIAVPGLMSSSLLRAAEAIQRNTLFRSAYELLYTPLPEERKRTTKAVIDVAFDRLGTLIGSGMAMVVLVLPMHGQLSLLLGIVVVLALATLPVARALHTGYVAALERGLRDGAKKLDLPPFDGRRTTLSTIHEGEVRDELIDRVEALRDGGAAIAGPALEILDHPEPLLSRARELLSGNDERTRRALDGWNQATTPLASFGLALLAHKTLHREAQAALRKVACDVTGQLIDALLNPHMDFVVRRRVPFVLAVCATQRAADGLLLGIADERFEVRYECGRALLKVTQSNSEVVVSREKVFEAIRREVANWKPVVAGEFDEEAPGTDSLAFVSDLLAKDRLNRRLEHIFTILSMHLEREPLRMAFRALHHEDQRHRGTALEYLQTVLPSELRDAVWPTLSEQGPLPEPRPTQQILDDLARATSALTRKSA
jgi:AAA family ATP:ADP antiporter